MRSAAIRHKTKNSEFWKKQYASSRCLDASSFVGPSKNCNILATVHRRGALRDDAHSWSRARADSAHCTRQKQQANTGCTRRYLCCTFAVRVLYVCCATGGIRLGAVLYRLINHFSRCACAKDHRPAILCQKCCATSSMHPHPRFLGLRVA